MMPWVYLLMDEKGRIYTGCTNNLRRRLQQHFSRGARSTKGWKSLKLIYAEELPSLSEARKREAQIKRMKKEKKLELARKGIPAKAKELCP
jgi:putative endonuclease